MFDDRPPLQLDIIFHSGFETSRVEPRPPKQGRLSRSDRRPALHLPAGLGSYNEGRAFVVLIS